MEKVKLCKKPDRDVSSKHGIALQLDLLIHDWQLKIKKGQSESCCATLSLRISESLLTADRKEKREAFIDSGVETILMRGKPRE